MPVLQPQGRGVEVWDGFTTNAAPAVLPNGSVLLVYRGSNTTADAAIGQHARHL